MIIAKTLDLRSKLPPAPMSGWMTNPIDDQQKKMDRLDVHLYNI